MPAKRMRIELFDSEGNKYTIAFEGQITRDKALRLLDLVELLGGMPSGGTNPEIASINEFSKYDKVRIIIQKRFPIVWFSSKDLRSAYEQEFTEPISLSTVATYLARLTNKGLLVKMRGSNRLKYRMTTSFLPTTVKQHVP